MTLDEMKAAGEKASRIQSALGRLKEVERTLDLVNDYAAKSPGSVWTPDLTLGKSNGYYRDPVITVRIPMGFIQRQAIDAVHEARRAVVQAGGDLPTASEQIQRGGR